MLRYREPLDVMLFPGLQIVLTSMIKFH